MSNSQSPSTNRQKEIFLTALDLPIGERRAFLEHSCAGDSTLRKEIEALLDAADSEENVLDQPQAEFSNMREKLLACVDAASSATFVSMLPERSQPSPLIGEMIGPYRLMEKIGEGGFGQVFVAHQEAPVKRYVALKLIRTGMDNSEVIARFEAERQAVALMDHPHIAKVFDAGTTEAGQPYFVMELVRGVSLTEYHRHAQPSLTDKIQLLISVCEAVQHAHQKGVIHRDLKPTNVMVTLHDGRPIVKVIDFGVAKAISEPLTQRTLYTRFAQMIGTPLYMSPEQAEMSGLDVDTRSDIYSLGVMLYESLTGTTPFDLQRLQSASFDELRRIIREEDPPPPSRRVSTLAGTGSTQRKINPSSSPERDLHTYRQLIRTLHGDLDWIVMKAIEKDRRRRYETAADLARDLQRYLSNEPVMARPPSPGYRLKKFAIRNKVVLSTASLVFLILLVSTAVSTWQALAARRAEAEADRLRQDAVQFVVDLKAANILLDSARANLDEERYSVALKDYNEAIKLQPEHSLAWSGRGSMYVRLGMWHHAASDFEEALNLGAQANNPGWWGVPQLLLFTGHEQTYMKVRKELLSQLNDRDSMMQILAIRGILMSPGQLTDDQRTDIVANLSKPIDFGPRSGKKPRSDRMPPLIGRDFPKHGLGAPPDHIAKSVHTYTFALSKYRFADPRGALNALDEQFLGDFESPLDDVALPLRALCYHKTGNPQEALRYLGFATQSLNAWIDDENEIRSKGHYPWFDLIELVILYREAYRSIHGIEPPELDKFSQLEDDAATTLFAN
ncbi:serine/threonine protein kinase [Lacunimicrobium album]